MHYLEEVTNVRSTKQRDLWADIGGYVGMIMGISILQMISTITEMVQRFWERVFTRRVQTL